MKSGVRNYVDIEECGEKFSAVVEKALSGTPQEVSCGGKVVVMVLSREDYKFLLTENGQAPKSFADHLLSFPGREIERAQAKPRDVTF